MLDLFKKTILIVFISLIPSKLFAENKFCLDTEGFIYPIFDNENCDEKSDETINEKEFSYIIDLDDKSRIAKLNEYSTTILNIPQNSLISIKRCHLIGDLIVPNETIYESELSINHLVL